MIDSAGVVKMQPHTEERSSQRRVPAHRQSRPERRRLLASALKADQIGYLDFAAAPRRPPPNHGRHAAQIPSQTAKSADLLLGWHTLRVKSLYINAALKISTVNANSAL